MNNRIKLKPLTIALLAFAGTMMVVPLAKAQSFTPGNADLYLEVTDTGDSSSQGYVVDLGDYSTFTAVGAGDTITVANVSADLQSLFGSSTGQWQSSQATFQVIGDQAANPAPAGQPSAHTVFVSSQTGAAAVTDWQGFAHQSNGGATLAAGSASGDFTSLKAGLTGYTAGTTPGSVKLAAAGGISDQGISGDSAEASVGDGEGNSFLPAELELFELPPNGTSGTNLNKYSGTVDDLGYFTLQSNGDLDFTAAGQAVPEPSTYALLAAGLALLVVGNARRFRNPALTA